MKQTAVQWFYCHYMTEMQQHGEIEYNLLNKLFEQAKAMEKKQTIEFAEEYSSKCSSVHNGIVFNSEPADQYYNKKYSQE